MSPAKANKQLRSTVKTSTKAKVKSTLEKARRYLRIERLEDRRVMAGEMGLRADFYHAASTVFSATSIAVTQEPVLSRIDQQVNFQWGLNSPAASVRADRFAVRWSGQIKTIEAGVYTFETKADDGVRLWVNGQRIINRWSNGSTTNTVRLLYRLIRWWTYVWITMKTRRMPALVLVGDVPAKHDCRNPRFSLYPFSKPVQIQQGGIYVGSWENLVDTSIAAITVNTNAKVTIARSNLRSVGDLIDAADYEDSTKTFDLVVRDTSGLGLQPPTAGKLHGAFLRASRVTSLLAENNLMEKVSLGIAVSGYAGSSAADYPIVIRNNRGKNIEGRYPLPDGSLDNGPTVRENYYFSHFIQIAGGVGWGTYGIPGVDISWNEVINDPYHSRVEDNISIYQASGTALKPIRIHNNFIQGAYHGDPTEHRQFTGTAIQIDSNGVGLDQATPETSTAYVDIGHNIAVGSIISDAVGHNITIHNNRVVYSGWLPDGGRLWSYVSGISFGDYRDESLATRFNLAAYDNVVGAWNQNQDWGGEARNDLEFSAKPGAIDVSRTVNNTSLTADPTAPIPYALELAEVAGWEQKVLTNNKVIGPRAVLIQQATSRIQFENYHQMFGVDNYGSGLGYLDSGDWVRFRGIEFAGNERRLTMNAATPHPDFAFEVRLGSQTGPLLGRFNFAATGSWGVAAERSFQLTSAPVGRQDVFFVFLGAANVDWFQFGNAVGPLNASSAQRKSEHGNGLTGSLDSNLVDLYFASPSDLEFSRRRILHLANSVVLPLKRSSSASAS